jgi:hypothetical protein
LLGSTTGKSKNVEGKRDLFLATVFAE